MFKKRAARQEQVDIGLEKIEKQEQGNGSDEEDLLIKTKKKVKVNPKNEEQDDSKNKVQDIINAEMDDLKYKSNEGMLGNRKDLATVYNEIDTDESMDARAIALKRMEISQQIREGKLSADVYRGKNYSTQYTTKSDEQIRNSKVTGSMGPVRAPANVRMTCRFDYDPSLCKDYHDTGYCVFGDSCLYLHDRGDYKNGQEQEQEWQREQKRKQKALQEGEDSDSEADEVEIKLSDKEVPKKCQICNSKLRNPVKTICDHYFCEGCALQNYATSKTCYTCERNTQGVFQDATYILIKLAKERQEEKKRLKATVTSRKALKMLDDTEDSDESQGQAEVLQAKSLKRKKQNKQKKETKEIEVERTYIDENGVEIIETVIQRVSNDQDEEKENSDNDNSNQSGEENQYDDENEEENNHNDDQNDKQDGEDINVQLALNQINKTKKKQKFKPSASGWLMN